MYLSKGCRCEVVLCLWFCCYLLLAVGQTDPTEVDALRTIKESLIDVNGNLSSWSNGDPCTSNWTGVLCSSTTLVDGYLHVQQLQLPNLNLSGTLAPEIGRLSYLEIMDFMWNNISGSIPKEIGNIKTLKLLLLSGNHLRGLLPEELGYLPVLDRMQIDQNNITGSIPSSFANLNSTQHFHMNNNSLSGQIPPKLSRLGSLLHLLLDNNKLSGYLPSELSEMPSLKILQLDNNNFGGNSIPDSYVNMSKLLKLSLRNCNLQGPIPDLSRIPDLGYLDLSFNQLNESILSKKLSENITTIDLSNNKLTGTIPSYFSGLPHLQKLSLANNSLSGNIPSNIWQNKTNATEMLLLDMQNNQLTSISGSTNLPPNVTVLLEGNPLCSNNNTLVQFCGAGSDNGVNSSSSVSCPSQACPPPYEYNVECFCAAPLIIDYRLKSPGFSDFRTYVDAFESFLTDSLNIHINQLFINSFAWEEGPRLRMYLKLFPIYVDNRSSHIFNTSEVFRIRNLFREWTIQDSDLFGPYELIDFILLDPYRDVIITSPSSGISKGALAGIVLGAIAGAVTLSAIVSILILRIRLRDYRVLSRRRNASRISMKFDGVRSFDYEEMALATNNFSDSAEVGQGGYGKVYKGILSDGTLVAIKRAQEGSLQGEMEFRTEIHLLSRVHHRNLVSLIGYCDEKGEQMLVYEYMPNGTLRDHLSVHSKEPLSFPMRLKMAIGSAKGLLYLHTEADPPIFHRDVKASNILLDSKFTAKVADFGLSRLAPVPDIEGNLPGHVSTVVKGTPGYLDPEYFLTHKLTDKSDVYSLGVVFLELVTGRPPIFHGENIIRQVTVAFQSGGIFSVVDKRMGSYPSECLGKFLTLALKCCENAPDERPKMAEVVRELENIWSMISESDAKGVEYVASDSGTIFSSPHSSSTLKTHLISGDVSGSDLVSGDIPSIKPR
ncbi:probable LRR receptor-like serine/threonine-protein kinase At1g06840 isoform X2 [Gastrolobium bilobum]|uniref:probable LRR receptor-like serine/threonine-protein kinase At1g06840 isoform X2 n=1 Tax=Gastrolobium bilobum TaxID=150636 RepID=UPI002AB0CDEB|nr:probable LRR receptor-like serine/threonine-protein kinase At1g06840 isoform X2 [Gastrolobium bilobum]